MTTDLYRNRDFIADFDDIIAETAARSRALTRTVDLRPDVAYGSHPRETMDLIFPPKLAKGAPLHMFVHGGYWRTGTKEDHRLMAAPALAVGAVAAIITYDLMPGTRLGAIINQVRSAARHLAAMAPTLNADASRLTVSGHSAGAHLISYLAAQGPHERVPPELVEVRGMLLASGLYDLSEIPHSFLKNETQMTDAEALAWSPLTSRQHAGPQRIVMLSEHDTPPFHIQGERFASQLEHTDNNVEFRIESGLNHLTVVLALSDPHSPAGACLASLIEQS